MSPLALRIALPIIAVLVFFGALSLPKFLQKTGAIPTPLGIEEETPVPAKEAVSAELVAAAKDLQTDWQNNGNVSSTAAPAQKASPVAQFAQLLALRDLDGAEKELAKLEANDALDAETLESLKNALAKNRTEESQILALEKSVEQASIAGAVKKDLPAPPPLPENASILFGADSSRISDNTRADLEKIVAKAKASERFQIQVRGYTDKSGDTKYNAILAEARAETVRDVLIELGLPPVQVTTLAFGESQAEPTAADNDESQRRVELVFRYR